MRLAVVALAVVGCATAGSTIHRPSPSQQHADDFGELLSSGLVLEVGSSVSGDLTTVDHVWDPDGSYMQVWELEQGWGAEVTIDLMSDEFDAFLWVVSSREVLSDDDGGGYCNSRVTLHPDPTERYRIIVNTISPGEVGKFTLAASRTPAPPDGRSCPFDGGDDPDLVADDTDVLRDLPTEGRVLDVGSTDFGSLSAADALFQNSFVEAWSLPLSSDDEVTVDLRSEDFDTFLWILGPNLELSNDDGGGSCNSRITFAAPATEEYTIVATSFGGRASGEYSISVSAFPAGVLDGECDLGLLTDDIPVRLENLTAEPGVLQVGDEVRAALITDDALTDESRFVKVFEVEGSEGDRLFIEMSSTEFDTYLWLSGHGLDTGDDDGAGNCNSLIDARLPETGVYRVGASSFRQFATGEFLLAIGTEPGPERPGACSEEFIASDEDLEADLLELPTQERLLQLGSDERGELTRTDETPSGGYFQAWALAGEPGASYVVELISTDFDAYLYASGPDFFISDDDSGNNCNSSLRVRLGDGTNRVYVTSFSQGDVGRYRIRVLEQPGPAEAGGCGGGPDDFLLGRREQCAAMVNELPTSGVLEREGITRGSLGPEDILCDDGTFLDAWEVEARQGEVLTVDLISTEFDTYMYVGGPGIEMALADDDDGGACNSRIEVEFPESGRYRVVASSYNERARGRFAIRVSANPPPPRTGSCPDEDVGDEFIASPWSAFAVSTLSTEGRIIRVGDEVVGRLTVEDPVFSNGAYVQAWELVGRPGERVTVDLGSETTDMFLAVYGPELTDVLTNDDGGEATDSRLTFTIPEEDAYTVIVVSTFSAGDTGRFVLAVSAEK